MTKKKRDRLEVIYDMLLIIQKHRKIKPTPLLRYSNLSTQRFNEYISDLLEKDFVIEHVSTNDRKHYTLSDRGHYFLEQYKLIQNFIDEFDL